MSDMHLQLQGTSAPAVGGAVLPWREQVACRVTLKCRNLIEDLIGDGETWQPHKVTTLRCLLHTRRHDPVLLSSLKAVILCCFVLSYVTERGGHVPSCVEMKSYAWCALELPLASQQTSRQQHGLPRAAYRCSTWQTCRLPSGAREAASLLGIRIGTWKWR